MIFENPVSSSLFRHRVALRIFKFRMSVRGTVRRMVFRKVCKCAYGTVNVDGVRRIRKELGFLVTGGLVECTVVVAGATKRD